MMSVMKKYPAVHDLQNRITSDNTVQLTFQANDIHDLIHPFSVSGYEYLSGEFVEFLDRYRPILPKKMPIILKIAGKSFESEEKEIIDRAVWMHYGLYLSEAADNLKKTVTRMVIYLLLMILSSLLMFWAAGNTNELIVNYGSVLFWFFGYRLLIHLVLDCLPIFKEYRWYRRLTALKLVFDDDPEGVTDPVQLSREASRYAHEADVQTKNNGFVNHVLMEDSCVSLGCRIEQVDAVFTQSGADGLEIISTEMAEYLMSALPFIKRSSITRLTIEGTHFSKEEQKRISSAIRNYLAFTIAGQDADQRSNNGISIFFVIGLLISSAVLYLWGKKADLALHEFILVAFWFFADYLLEFVILTGTQISRQKKILEKLANMDIDFKCE